MKNKNESYWKIVKYSIKEFFKSETSELGKINIIGGIFTFILVLLICIPSSLFTIACVFFPKVKELGMPWYGNVAMVVLLVLYFMYCANKVGKINNKKEKIDT